MNFDVVGGGVKLPEGCQRQYDRGALQGFLRGWYQGVDKRVVIDKSRAWRTNVETLLKIAPKARHIVCLRELGQVDGSIEPQRQKTALLDFIDQMADPAIWISQLYYPAHVAAT
jgi:hypothetical protein